MTRFGIFSPPSNERGECRFFCFVSNDPHHVFLPFGKSGDKLLFIKKVV